MAETAVLVTGAAGFIGYHIARELLQAGHAVVGLDSLNTYYDPALKQARLDLLTPYPRFSFVHAAINISSSNHYRHLYPEFSNGFDVLRIGSNNTRIKTKTFITHQRFTGKL